MFARHTLLASVAVVTLNAQTAEVRLPEVTVHSSRVAVQEPAATFAMPVSGLRYEPVVDVQSRNMAEGQADVAIRGGIFENSGFRLGAVTLYDPQTGHYFAEIPIAPSLLTAPEILTGADNALRGWNANAGTVIQGWRPVRTGGQVVAGYGEYDTQRGEVHVGQKTRRAWRGRRLGIDGTAAHSRSDGSRPFGEHEFTRYNARVQLADESSQTDLVYGYQSKAFGWPNLYTPFANVYETESLQTALVLLNHRVARSNGDFAQVGAYYRRNKDHYVFNRADPGAFNPAFATGPAFHKTWVRGAAVEGRETVGEIRWNFAASATDDDLTSTSLVFGPFSSRRHWKASLAPEADWPWADVGMLTTRVGVVFDDTNRERSAVSPVVDVSLAPARAWGGVQKVHASYARTTQTTTYFALNSRATAGLFRGNPTLGRQFADHFEVGATANFASWTATAAVFHRRDDDLVDWTYADSLPNARSANAVDIDTTGFEAVLRYRAARVDLVLGYTGLAKDEDYGSAAVSASFYALNYPEHRLTAAATVRVTDQIELRIDNEFRVQRENALRRFDDEAWLSSLSLQYRPPAMRGLSIWIGVDNLWGSDFEEVPAVPAARRQVFVGAGWAW